jgi:hypothetical protein
MNLIKDTVINNNHLTPTEFYLSQNYPNPFKEKTTIKFCIAYKTNVKLRVFSKEGELIRVLINEEKEAGTYQIDFNALGLSEGTYFYQLQAGDFSEWMKMTLLC